MAYITNYNPTLRETPRDQALTWSELDENFSSIRTEFDSIGNIFSDVYLKLGNITGSSNTVITSLDDLTDVNITGPITGNILSYNGSQWTVANSSVLTSLSFASGTGILTAVSAAATITTNLDGRYLRSVNGITGDAAGNVTVSGGGAVGAPLDSPNFTGNPTITTANAASALTITQTGTGNALTVNDSGSDLTPFVITGNGDVGVGKSSPAVKLDVDGVINAGTGLQIGGVLVTPTAAELNFVDGVTSSIQTQLNSKAPKSNPVFTAGVTMTGPLNLGAGVVGTAGQVLTSAGAGLTPTWTTPSSGSTTNIQIFTASGTWTKPTGHSANAIVTVELWGGGGGGGRSSGSISGSGGGGGGGAYMRREFLISDLPSTLAITVGAGGTGHTSSNGSGNNGGNSTVGTLVTAYGGGGGGSSSSDFQSGGCGGGELTAGSGQTSVGRIGGGSTFTFDSNGDARTIFGGGGGGAVTVPVGGYAVFGGGGGGGSSSGGTAGGLSVFAGAGGAGGDSNPVPTDGVAPAGGGGGGFDRNAGNGARGEVRITTRG